MRHTPDEGHRPRCRGTAGARIWRVLGILTVLSAAILGSAGARLPAGARIPGATHVYQVPASIARDCSVDAAPALNRWLDGLPSGTPATHLLIRFSRHACYQVDESLFLHDVTDVVVDGNGATFRQVVLHPLQTVQSAPMASYCGSGTQFGPKPGRTAYGQRTDIVWWFDGGCDITIENMKIQGPNVGGGAHSGGGRQVDSAIEMSGVQRAVITDTTIEHVDGDFVTIGGLIDATPQQGNQQAYPATDIRVYDNIFTTSGRQGISVTTGGTRIAVEHNTISGVAASVFDLESDTAGGCECDVNIAGNSISGGYPYLLAALTGSAVDRLAFVDNTLSGGSKLKVQATIGIPSSDWTFARNTAHVGSTWPWPSISINSGPHGSGRGLLRRVSVADNSIPYPMNGEPFALAGSNATGVAVRNNHLPGVARRSTVLHSNAGANYSCGSSATSGGRPVDGTCPSRYVAPVLPQPPIAPGGAPTTAVRVPSAGAVVNGTQVLAATGSSDTGHGGAVTGVTFYLSGASGRQTPIGKATLTLDGWISFWDTTTVANGTYTLRSVARKGTRPVGASAGVAVTVANPGSGATPSGTASGTTRRGAPPRVPNH